MRLLVFLLLVLTINPFFAQRDLGGFVNYTTTEGLLSNYTHCGIFDRDNFLWIGTDRGLSRFDGTTFQHFTTNEGLPDNEIIRILEDEDGTIWVQPFQREPAFLIPGDHSFTNIKKIIPPDTILKDCKDHVYKIFRLENGMIALLSGEGAIRLIYHRKWVRTLWIPGITGRPDFAYMTGTGKEICVFYPLYDVSFDLSGSAQITERKVEMTWTSSEGNRRVLIKDDNTIICAELDRAGKVTKKREIPWKETILRTGFFKDDLVIGEYNGRVILRNWYTGKERTLGFQTQVASAIMNKSGSIRVLFTANEGVFIDFSDTPDSYHPLARLPYHLFIDNGIPKIMDNYFNVVFPVPAQKAMLSPEQWDAPRLTERVGDHITTYGPITYDLCKTGTRYAPYVSAVKDVYILDDSIRYLATSAGVFTWDRKNHQVRKLYAGRTTTVSPGPGGSIFIGTYRGLLELKKSGVIIRWGEKNEALYSRITDLVCRNKVVWVATSGRGLIALYNGRVQKMLSKTEVGGSDIITAIEEDDRQQLYIGYANGMEKLTYYTDNGYVKKRELTIFRTPPSEGIRYLRYTGGKLVGTGSAGVFIIPDNYREPEQYYNLRINRIMINDSVVRTTKAYYLQPGDYDFNLSFSAINFGKYPLRFRYRINNGNWIYTTEAGLRYTNLTSGIYRVTIQVINNYCRPTDTHYVLFNILPPVYARTWFLLLVIAGFSLLVFAVIRITLNRKYRKEKEALIYTGQLNEMELKALKAQINPHFVFNCLNSIKGLIYEEKLDAADKYLDHFSSLFRNTLDGSFAALHPVEKEAEYLTAYLELEQLRFSRRFTYTITIAENVDRSLSLIPPMLLQPYVENAVKHGVSGLKDRKGEIHISFMRAGDELHCMITDNGAGRRGVIKKPESHVARGMSITAKRAELHDIQAIITDNEPFGTIVELIIPFRHTEITDKK